MTRSASPVAGTRAERRRLEREERRARQHQPRRTGRQTSPVLLFTIAAFMVGIVLVGFLVLQQVTAPASAELTPPGYTTPSGLAEGRTLGQPDAPVTVQVWSDFQCPACRSLAISVEPGIIQQFVQPGTAKLVYSDAAFQGQRGSNPNWDESVAAAAGARCAADQGLFWQMHDWLYTNWQGENVGSFRQDRLRAIAAAVGLDMTSYDSCMAAGDKQTAVRSETLQAVNQGVGNTPTLVINGTAYVGLPAYSDLVSIINEAAASPIP